MVKAVLAQRLKLAPSILLVAAGIALALVPGIPPVELAPELVLLVILPPLIYSAGVSMSWREFKFNLRPIFLLAFGCVIFTTCAVADAVHYLLSWQWGAAFIVGAIVALGDTLFPQRSFAAGLAADFDRTSHFLVRLRMWHPLVAVTFSIYVMTLITQSEALDDAANDHLELVAARNQIGRAHV